MCAAAAIVPSAQEAMNLGKGFVNSMNQSQSPSNPFLASLMADLANAVTSSATSDKWKGVGWIKGEVGPGISSQQRPTSRSVSWSGWSRLRGTRL